MDSELIREKYPDRIPIILDSIFKINKNKFLVQNSVTIGQFIYQLRQKIIKDNYNHISYQDGLYLYVMKGNKSYLLNSSNTIQTIYDEYKYDDGFLYFKLVKENTFGCFNIFKKIYI